MKQVIPTWGVELQEGDLQFKGEALATENRAPSNVLGADCLMRHHSVTKDVLRGRAVVEDSIASPVVSISWSAIAATLRLRAT